MLNKTILGSSFDDFVSNQLRIRSEILSSTSEEDIKKGILPKEKLNVLIGNTSFVKLSSAINISEEKALSFGKKEYGGMGLAKSFVLRGGTLKWNESENTFSLRGGGLKNYRIGGTEEFGFRPMPGITSAKVVSRGRWGSLREATINIKCFNREQLSVIETLYLRPGYTILLEFGNSIFYDNDFKLINSYNLIDFFTEGKTLESIHYDILEKREKYSGNYDGFIGPVSNFNISTNADGTYDCVCRAITWGTIIESLKINISGEAIKDNKTSSNSSPFITSFYNLIPEPEKTSESKLKSILDVIYKTCTQPQYNNGDLWSLISEDIYKKYMDQHPTGHSNLKNPTNINPKKISSFSAIPFQQSKGQSLNISNNGSNLNIYISLGSLLSIISKNCLIYSENNITPLLNKYTSLVNINFNPDENFCYNPDNHVSLDPNVCLIKYEGADLKELGITKFKLFNDVLPQFKVPGTKSTGYTMNIMININHIYKKLAQLQSLNHQKEAYLYDFLQELMNDINVALGGINSFNVSINSETNTLNINDTQITEDSGELTIINTTGLKSTIRNISIDSKLSNNLSSIIAIGAQASSQINDAGIVTGLDSSVFLRYNQGLKDRFYPIKRDANLNTLTLEEYINNLNNDDRANEVKKTITNIYIDRKLIQDNIDNHKLFYSDILKTIKTKTGSSTGIIPYTFNIKMNGISGIRYGQLFSIEPSRLPKSYLDPTNLNKPLVAFLVTHIEHSIENNTWITTIGGQTAPIRNLKVKS